MVDVSWRPGCPVEIDDLRIIEMTRQQAADQTAVQAAASLSHSDALAGSRTMIALRASPAAIQRRLPDGWTSAQVSYARSCRRHGRSRPSRSASTRWWRPT